MRIGPLKLQSSASLVVYIPLLADLLDGYMYECVAYIRNDTPSKQILPGCNVQKLTVLFVFFLDTKNGPEEKASSAWHDIDPRSWVTLVTDLHDELETFSSDGSGPSSHCRDIVGSQMHAHLAA
ncbi:hypothetical protein F4820DRAFT_439016 [Hypoxylon rubiginosum]|uniref:Uncharacterized protein n=1 Tax=Hypoxylon rubiginosum TaxID=110542 RepID=A0ACB9YKK4_9PEZI|nr:hypothetical protein F4820DRAFT_439016 [Hypoxylon rubiginosum]